MILYLFERVSNHRSSLPKLLVTVIGVKLLIPNFFQT